MKSKNTCPKCQSAEIYTDAGLSKSGDRSSIPVSSWSKVFVDVYVCLSCGYMEEYMDFKDAAVLDKLKKNWKPLKN